MDFRLELRNVERGEGEKRTGPRFAIENLPSSSLALLRREDNDVARFWAYVIAALQTIAPSLGATTLALLESPSQAPALSMFPIKHLGEKESRREASSTHASEPDRIEIALTALINEIAATQPGVNDRNHGGSYPFILVLDDYHIIETEPSTRTNLFARPFASSWGLHLVIASRTDPPLPLSRLRGEAS